MAKKLHTMSSFTKILPIVSRIFPEGLLKSLAKECFPGDYDRKASPQELIRALLKAQTLLLPSQEEIIKKNPRLGLSARTSLTYNFCLPSLLQFAKEMMSHLHQIHPMINSQLLATPRLLLDTMPQTLPATQRGKGAKINNVSRGMGVMFAFNLDAMPGQCPIDILGIFRGSWNDTYKVRQVALIANGPVYIADRGFYSRETVKLWLDQHINFIVRGKSAKMSWESDQRQL